MEIGNRHVQNVNLYWDICEKQQKKSVRLNAAILLELEARGLDLQHSHPIIVEGLGLGFDFYTPRRYDDVLGATAKGVSLPPQVSELKSFSIKQHPDSALVQVSVLI